MILGRFTDQDHLVRATAAMFFAGCDSLSERQVEGLIQLLHDKHSTVARSAEKALWKQKSLPNLQIQNILHLLLHQDHNVRFAAAEVLSGLQSLPELYIQRITDLLKSEITADQAFRILGWGTNFAQLILKSDTHSLGNLLRSWLRDSFVGSPGLVTLYDDELFVEALNKNWTVKVESKQQQDFKLRWRLAQSAVQRPVQQTPIERPDTVHPKPIHRGSKL